MLTLNPARLAMGWANSSREAARYFHLLRGASNTTRVLRTTASGFFDDGQHVLHVLPDSFEVLFGV